MKVTCRRGEVNIDKQKKSVNFLRILAGKVKLGIKIFF